MFELSAELSVSEFRVRRAMDVPLALNGAFMMSFFCTGETEEGASDVAPMDAVAVSVSLEVSIVATLG
jgi:hypothetical protein